MRTDIVNGILSGLVGGIVFGIMMQMMTAPTPDGGEMPMMAMVAKVVRSDSMAVGWLYHLFNSAVIGAIFGWLLGSRSHGIGPGVGWGAAYGFVVDLRRIDIDAALPRHAAFRAASDGADASGRDGKSGGTPRLRGCSRRRVRHVSARDARFDPARVGEEHAGIRLI